MTKGYAGGEWDSSSFYGKWTFTVAAPMLEKGYHSPLQAEDLMRLPQHERTVGLLQTLERALASAPLQSSSARSTWYQLLLLPRILRALIRANWVEVSVITFYTVAEGIVRIASPVVLFYLIEGLQETSKGEDFSRAYFYAGLLGLLGVAQTLIHHVLFFYSMRLGWNWKCALSALLYRSLFKLNAASIGQAGTGRLMNLISNDMTRFEEFSVFMLFFPVSILEALGVMIVLIYQLNFLSAIAAVGLTMFLIPGASPINAHILNIFSLNSIIYNQFVQCNYTLLDSSPTSGIRMICTQFFISLFIDSYIHLLIHLFISILICLFH